MYYMAMWMSVSLFIATPLLLRPRPPGAPPLLRRPNNRHAREILSFRNLNLSSSSYVSF
jgi:hypothetical protein